MRKAIGTTTAAVFIMTPVCAIFTVVLISACGCPASREQWPGRWRLVAAPARVVAVLRSPAADAQHRGVPATAPGAPCPPSLPLRSLQSPRWRTVFGRRVSPGTVTSRDRKHRRVRCSVTRIPTLWPSY